MKQELEIISDIVNPSNNKIVKSDIVYKKIFDLDRVEIEQYISTRGRIVKKYCTIIQDNKFYKLNHSYEYMSRLVLPIQVNGFVSKSKRWK